MVTSQVWHKEILPVLDSALSSKKFHAKGQIGRWVVESIGDDPHIHEFFSLNWKKVSLHSRADVRSWHVAHIQDLRAVQKLLGLDSAEGVAAHRDQFLEFLKDPRFRICLKDPDLINIEKFSDEKQKEIALRAPAFIFCPEERASLSLNTTYYGQFKSKACLGMLEEFLLDQARLNEQGAVTNYPDLWISMHAGAVEYVTEKKEKRGVVIVGPTGHSKSTHAYGLSTAKKQNRMHSDDWLFINADTGTVLAAEQSFYMRTVMAGFYPELGPIFLSQPLENVPGVQDLTDPQEVLPQLCKTLASRAMMDWGAIWDASKLTQEVQLTDLFLVKRDYQDPVLFEKISADRMVGLLISEENVFQYANGKQDAQGNPALEQRTTEFYYNPYLCRVEIDPKTKMTGDMDRVRLSAWRHLAGLKGLRIFSMNARLPVPEMQERLRRFLESDEEKVQL